MHFWTLEDTSRKIRAREVSSLELTRAAIERGRRIDPALNAFACFTEERALQDARRADEAVARGGADSRSMPLLGIPVSVKDMFETADAPTTAGSRVRWRESTGGDAQAVRRLRDAGAVIIGKTNVSEYAWGSVQSACGSLANPWDLARFAGGSSSGSGASLAAGIGYASLGGDTAGSIRMPAAFCGVVGMKPTFGSVSCRGAIPLAWTMDCAGPLARTAADARIALQAIREPAGEASASAASRRIRVVEATIGLPKSHFFEELDAEVARAMDEALRVLERLGLRFRDVEIPFAPQANLVTAVLLQVEAAAAHRALFAEEFDSYGDVFRGRLVQGMLIPGHVYLKAQRLRARMRRELDAALDGVDAILTPTTAIAAHSLSESPRNSPRVADIGRCTSPASLAGLPALSLPCGFTRGDLPIGMQLIGRAFEDDLLLEIGIVYQAATDWHQRHPSAFEGER